MCVSILYTHQGVLQTEGHKFSWTNWAPCKMKVLDSSMPQALSSSNIVAHCEMTVAVRRPQWTEGGLLHTRENNLHQYFYSGCWKGPRWLVITSSKPYPEASSSSGLGMHRAQSFQ